MSLVVETRDFYFMENTGKGIGFLERVLTLIKQYKLWDFVKAFIVILMVALLTFCITKPEKVFEYFQTAGDEIHIEKIEHRLKTANKIQNTIDRLLYKVDASRVLILENHNGSENTNGLPFFKATCTYESLNEGVWPIAEQYQNTNLSLIPFSTYLYNNTYWCGNTVELKAIDKSLHYRMLSNGTEHFAATLIQGVGKPIGFMFVSFESIPDEHSCEEVKQSINKAAMEVALILEMNKN